MNHRRIPHLSVLKKWKDKIRMCLDFLALNLVTERPIFPILSTEEMMDVFNGLVYFTTLDLENAFYQFELNEQSKKKTVFSTKNEQYCFNRFHSDMPLL